MKNTRRKPGRPYLGDKGRVKVFQIRLKIDEYEWLMNIAKEHNMTVSELLRSAVHQLYDTSDVTCTHFDSSSEA